MLRKAATLIISAALVFQVAGVTISANAAPRTRPSAPQSLVATPDNAKVLLSWKAPASNGGARISGYSVFFASSASGPWQKFGSDVKKGRVTVTGLTNGTPYWFRVTAKNKVGTGRAVVTAEAVVPLALPSEPLEVTAVPGNGSATVSWKAPATDGGLPLTDYVVHHSTSATGPWTEFAVTNSLVAVASGLTNGTPYWFRVSARNEAGTGLPAQFGSITPRTVPQPPLDVVGTPGDGTVDVAWKPPAFNGGASITGYTVAYATSPTGPWFSIINDSKKLSAAATGLKNGTPYWFQVYATNAAGIGSPAVLSGSITPRTIPLSPQDVAVTAGDGKLTATWKAPAFDGGVPVTGYTASYATSVQGPWTAFATDTTALTATATGLTNGTQYWVRVLAKNSAGAGAPAVGGPVTPIAPPAAPSPSWAETTSTAITVTWPAVTNATRYECSAGSGTAVVNGTTCVISNLAPDTLASVSVTACNAGGCGTAGTVPVATHPVVPNSAWWTFDGQNTPGGARAITVAWSGGAAQTFCVHANGTRVGCTSSGSYSMPTVTPTENVTFMVQVQNRLSGAITGQVSTSVLPPVPSAPTGLVTAPNAGLESADGGSVQAPITSSWSPTAGASHYLLLRSGASGPWRVDGATTYQDNTMSWNTTFGYQVAACASQGCSAYSSTVTEVSPPAPVSVVALRIDKNATWNAGSLPAGVRSWRIKTCNRTVNASCDPVDSPTWTSGWRTQTGAISTDNLISGNVYAWVVVGRVNSDGTGNGTTSRVYTVSPR